MCSECKYPRKVTVKELYMELFEHILAGNGDAPVVTQDIDDNRLFVLDFGMGSKADYVAESDRVFLSIGTV